MAITRVLYVHASDELYGADRILLSLVGSLPRDAFSPIVVLPTDIPYSGRLTDELRRLGVPVLHYPLAVLRRRFLTPRALPSLFARFLLSVWFLVRVIARYKVDIVHSNTSAVLPGAFAARACGRLHVWHLHEIIKSPRWMARVLAFLVPRLSTSVVAVSQAVLTHWIESDGRNALVGSVIHNGIEASAFEAVPEAAAGIRSQWGFSPHDTVVGMVGRVSKWKGQDAFLAMAKQVAATNDKVRFAIVGGGFRGGELLLEELREQVASFPFPGRMIWDDFREDIPNVLGAMDMFVMPSTLPDPFPTVVLEAMAAGKPIVAFAHGGVVEMIEHGVSGLLAPVGDTRALAEAVLLLAQSEDSRVAVGAAAKQSVRSKFGVAPFVEKWVTLYSQLSGCSR